MEIRYEKHWSSYLNREMEFKVYGHGGKSVLFIPCQGGRFFDFENFKMVDAWAPWIESGQCRVFSADCIDNEAWGAKGADNRWRIENHERWFNYIVNELVPADSSRASRRRASVFRSFISFFATADVPGMIRSLPALIASA